jgi:hypothetical protein
VVVWAAAAEWRQHLGLLTGSLDARFQLAAAWAAGSTPFFLSLLFFFFFSFSKSAFHSFISFIIFLISGIWQQRLWGATSTGSTMWVRDWGDQRWAVLGCDGCGGEQQQPDKAAAMVELAVSGG